MGQTDNSSLGFEFSNVFSNILLERKHILCVFAVSEEKNTPAWKKYTTAGSGGSV